MGMRGLLVKGAMAAALATAGIGLTAGPAHADGIEVCTHNFYLQTYYYEAYQSDWANYQSTVFADGGQPAADYYHTLYEMDYASYQYYTAKVNGCLIREP
jgi:hypothetical protein